MVAGLLAALVCCSPPGASRAGTLDKALLGKEMGEIIAEVESMPDLDVALGVLPFKVKKGARPASYAGAPLCLELPRRIENALIVSMKVRRGERPVDILRDAGASAAQGKVGSYTTDEAEFHRLFDRRYPRAWGNKAVKPNAFLHGTVTNVGDRKKAVVTMELFDEKCWKRGKIVPRKTWTLTVRTDRPLLADLGYGFALARGAFDGGDEKAKQRDEAAVAQAAAEDEKAKAPPAAALASAAHNPEDIGGFSFEIRYNGKPQPLKPLAGGKGAAQPQFEAPTPAGTVTLHMTRKDGDPVKKGVLLLVNGKSTYDEEAGDPLLLRRWTFDTDMRGRPEEWKGFHYGPNAKLYRPFKVLTAKESAARAAEFGTHAGWIHLYVFVSRRPAPAKSEKPVKGAAPPAKVEPPPAEKEEYVKPKLFSLRSMPEGRPATFTALRGDLMGRNRIVEKKGSKRPLFQGRGFIVPEVEAVAGPASDETEFPNPELIASLAIRYFAPGGKKIEAKSADE
jgi:hypothetical protein